MLNKVFKTVETALKARFVVSSVANRYICPYVRCPHIFLCAVNFAQYSVFVQIVFLSSALAMEPSRVGLEGWNQLLDL